jgi:hypothetical protein
VLEWLDRDHLRQRPQADWRQIGTRGGKTAWRNRASGLLRINDIDERMELENAATVSLFERILDQALSVNNPGPRGVGGLCLLTGLGLILGFRPAAPAAPHS